MKQVEINPVIRDGIKVNVESVWKLENIAYCKNSVLKARFIASQSDIDDDTLFLLDKEEKVMVWIFLG